MIDRVTLSLGRRPISLGGPGGGGFDHVEGLVGPHGP